MKIKFLTLTLQCKESKEIIDLSKPISFFHGQISSGKSSIARLIDYCLGGDFEKTPALQSQLISASLLSQIEDNEVLFEREKGSNNIQVSWKKGEKIVGSVLAPLDSAQSPIWENSVYNISDLIFYLMNFSTIKVRRSKINENSPLVRLSFRDIMWYCYLEQDFLDSSFYNLEIPIKGLKSRDVMRFIVGYYNEKINSLELELSEEHDKKQGMIEAINQISTFLKKLEYFSEDALKKSIDENNKLIKESSEAIDSLRNSNNPQNHLVDVLREELRLLNTKLQDEEENLEDIKYFLEQEISLSAEISSARFKLAKTTESVEILSGVQYEVCPNCGSKISQSKENPNSCILCKNALEKSSESKSYQNEIIRKDLISRYNEVQESINRRSWTLVRQKNIVEKMKQEKMLKDRKLKDELSKYDSFLLANSRELERKIASLEERNRNLNQIQSLFNEVGKLKEDSDKIELSIITKKRELKEEKAKLTNSINNINEIENTYLNFLNRVGVPGITIKDKVEINLITFEPSILPAGDQALEYTFFNAGSGGKKTLINVCYALAVHSVASRYKLPLPTFLIIDSPMKNIGEDVNKDLFENFYQLVYDLASNELKGTQFIIMDKEFIKPDHPEEIEISERFMTPDNPEYPPLISYYHGP